MQTLVIYDIPSDKRRRRISEVCKDYGLFRIQYSAFFGDLNHNRREELAQRLRKKLGDDNGNIQIYPMCDKDLRLRVSIGAGTRVDDLDGDQAIGGFIGGLISIKNDSTGEEPGGSDEAGDNESV